MVDEQLRARGITDERVLAAMGEVPRHEFVPAALIRDAYSDHPLPIGDGQTISQPYVVALMLESAQIGPDDVVLDIGTGSGYAAAVIARLAGRVVSVERMPALAESARDRLGSPAVSNVTVLDGDGSLGAPAEAPFDVIVVAAATPSISDAWRDQLRPGGRLVAPIGRPSYGQTLTCCVKRPDGALDCSALGGVAFVPLIGG